MKTQLVKNNIAISKNQNKKRKRVVDIIGKGDVEEKGKALLWVVKILEILVHGFKKFLFSVFF